MTEADFGADLGAEKFVDIKCRKSGLRPSAAVIVATVRAVKYHGGADVKNLTTEDLGALEKGLVNLERHVENCSKHYGLRCVVSLNKFVTDTDAELGILQKRMEELGVPVVHSNGWAEGGKGVTDLAHAVVDLCDKPTTFNFVYEAGPHTVPSHTVHPPLGALLTWCAMCVAQVRGRGLADDQDGEDRHQDLPRVGRDRRPQGEELSRKRCPRYPGYMPVTVL